MCSENAGEEIADESVPAWEPLGRALEAYLDGDEEAAAVVHLEHGRRELLSAAELCRVYGMPEVEEAALGLATGRVLDVGAGAGAHSLTLQRSGLTVVALDVAPRAVAVMRRRGVNDARCGDLSTLAGEHFDTILMLMNGAGLAGDLAGLGPLLSHCRDLLAPGGCLLLDSCDLRSTDDPVEQALITARQRRGRYYGEVRYRLAYEGTLGTPFGWLFIDARTLRRQAHQHGWRCQIVFQGDDGAYLARLTN